MPCSSLPLACTPGGTVAPIAMGGSSAIARKSLRAPAHLHNPRRRSAGNCSNLLRVAYGCSKLPKALQSLRCRPSGAAPIRAALFRPTPEDGSRLVKNQAIHRTPRTT
eukprot:12204658-Alexandrium_andersonii.AAC.1